MTRSNLLERFDDRGVFIRIARNGRWHSAGSDPHGAWPDPFQQPAHRRFRRRDAHFEIVLQIATGDHLIRRRADLDPALAHLFALGQDQIRLRKHAREEPAQRAITSHGAIGNARH